jgi:16S rRNA processing protein RimM
MHPDAFVVLGRVARTHGLNGEVSVVLTADLPVERLVGVEIFFTPPTGGVRSAKVTGVRPGPKGPLFSFEGVGSITAAETLRGRNVVARATDVPESAQEYDPVGDTVTDAVRGDLGEVVDVIVTGANDVWVVEGPFGQVLVPVIDSVVESVDEENGEIRVRLLPGLIDDE